MLPPPPQQHPPSVQFRGRWDTKAMAIEVRAKIGSLFGCKDQVPGSQKRPFHYALFRLFLLGTSVR